MGQGLGVSARAGRRHDARRRTGNPCRPWCGLQWDPSLLSAMDTPEAVLPEIRSSAEVYGTAVGQLSGCSGRLAEDGGEEA
ncbi:hypothetical protein GTW30_09080 [Streptomyces sp. SID7810]|nr:hypothetical protein [Streptomyces sp. SID7810]